MPGNPQSVAALPEAEQAYDVDGDALVHTLPSDVRTVVKGWLAHPRQAARGRCALHGIRAAEAAGYTLKGFAARGLLHVEGPAGAAVLAPLAFETREHESGSADDQRRLRQALDGAVGEHRYILHIRRPLPVGFDPGPVVQAVALWQHAVRRGEYIGRDAVYQDEGVHIELTLTDLPRHDKPALLMQANPIPGLERMGVVGSLILRLSALHAKVRDVGPLVPCLLAEPAWRLTRGHVEQVLYGTAREVQSICGSNPSYRAIFAPDGALFAEKGAESVAGVWWFEPTSGGVRAWAHENPWCDRRGAAPIFGGRRFAVLGDEGAQAFRLGWTD